MIVERIVTLETAKLNDKKGAQFAHHGLFVDRIERIDINTQLDFSWFICKLNKMICVIV